MAEREQWFPEESCPETEERITSCRRMPLESEEGNLRPLCWADYAGQAKTKANLQVFIEAALKREDALDHVLLYGPPGLGKTTLAGIVAAELGVELRVTTGPAIEKPGDLAAILTNLKPRSVLFIDEIHRLSRSVEEVLYPAMEDRVLDILIGKGPSAQSVRLDLAPFTLIGATTRAGSLSAPLRDRFGMIHRLELYQPEELAEILIRDARILGISMQKQAVLCLASRSRGTPRIAIRLLKRLRDFAQVRGEEEISLETAEFALQALGVDEKGLDETDRNILDKMMTYYQGGPVGLETLAAITGEDKATIEDMYEPYLMQIGFLTKTPRGRLLTPRAYQHLHREVPAGWNEGIRESGREGSDPLPLEQWKEERDTGDAL